MTATTSAGREVLVPVVFTVDLSIQQSQLRADAKSQMLTRSVESCRITRGRLPQPSYWMSAGNLEVKKTAGSVWNNTTEAQQGGSRLPDTVDPRGPKGIK